MEQKDWMDVMVQVKRMGNLLNEVQDLSQQMAEAIDRNDQVSVQLLVNMRREPIEKLMDVRRVLEEQLSACPEPADQRRLSKLLNGAPAQAEQERQLASLVAANRRRLDQVLALDQVLNKKMAREKSAYH